MRKNFAIFFILFISTNVFAGGPWVPGPKKAYIQLGWSGISFKGVNLNNVETLNGKNNYDFTYQIYSEFGLGDRGLFKFILPFKQVGSIGIAGSTPTSPIGSISGIGNITFGGKYLISDRNIKVSAGVDVQSGAFKVDKSLGLRTGYEAVTILPYLSIGSGFKKAYLSLDAGYGVMSNQYSSFVKINAEAGYKVTKRLYTILTFDVRSPMNNGTFGASNSAEDKRFSSNGSYVNNQLFRGVGIKLNYELKENKFGINASVLGAIGANNVAFAPAFNGGIYLKL